jgi:hypothetical protein
MGCPHCEKSRTKTNDYVAPTCGASECQENEYRANRERNARKRTGRKP